MGLLRTAARTAVITGTATRVHGSVAARQRNRWAAQTAAPPQAPPPPAAPPAPAVPPPAAPPPRDTAGMLAHLRELGELRAAGVLTDAEFHVQKDRILNG
jgi:hypothetical protein